MNGRNELLAKSSLMRMAWLSVKIIIDHCGIMLPILVIVCLPIDAMVVAATNGLTYLLIQGGAPEHLQFGIQMIFVSFANLIVCAVVALVIGQLIEGDTPTLRGTFSQVAGTRLAPVLGTLLYTGLLIALPMVLFVVVAMAGMSQFGISDLIGVLLLVAYVVALSCTIFLALNYVFSGYVAVFERTYYHRAAVRSTALVRGRRWWLAGVLFTGWVVLAVIGAAIVLLPDLFGIPEAGFDSMASIVRLALESLAVNIVLVWYSVFQVLIYFRRRREQHDLTFFDLSRIEVMHPASALLEPST